MEMKKCKLSEIASFIGSGMTPLRSNENYWNSKDYPWLKTEQLGEYQIFDTNEYISKVALEETNLKLFPKNTLSVAMYGEGKTRGNVSILAEQMTTNQACCNIIVDNKFANYKFVYYWLKNSYYKLRSLSSGVRNNLNSEDIKKFEINLPSLPTQQKIAAILSSLDDKIALNKKINAKLEAMAKRLYDYWFVQFDYPDKNGKPYKTSGGKMVWNEVLKREIPEGWEVGKIGDLFESQAGFAFNSSKWTETGHPVLTIKNIHSDGTISFDNTSFIESYDDKLEKYTVNNGNMIFAMSGNTIGKVGIISSSIENVLINQRVLIIKSSTSDIAFSYFIVSNPNVQNLVFQLGANSAQPNISEDEFRKIKICIPNKQFISKFNFQLKSFFDEVISNRIQIQKLTNLRDRLLPLLMNGQVEVEG